jgi:predicted nucleic acid-binding protein
MAKSNSGKPIYYFDACVFIDLIEHPAHEEPAKTIAAIIADAEDGRFEIITSTVTIAEVWHVKAEVDQKAPDEKVELLISRLWNPASSPIQLIDFHEIVAREAAALLRHGIKNGWKGTKGVDGIHLATAKREGADELFTTDPKMPRWKDILGLKYIGPAHYDPASRQVDLMEDLLLQGSMPPPPPPQLPPPA